MRTLTFLPLLLVLLATPVFAQDSKDPTVDGRKLSEWIRRLDFGVDQEKALVAIGKLGEKAEAALPVLCRVMEEPIIGEKVPATIAKIGLKAVPTLTKLLKSKKRSGPGSAALALGLIARNAPKKEADKILVLLLAEINADTRNSLYAEAALRELGSKALDVYLLALANPKTSQTAMETYLFCIEGMGTKAARAVPQLLKGLLAEKRKKVQALYVDALGAAAGNASKANCQLLVPHFIPFLKDSEKLLKLSAIRALGSLGKNVQVVDPNVGKHLLKSLAQSGEHQASAVKSLREIGTLTDEDVKNGVIALRKVLSSDSQERRVKEAKIIDRLKNGLFASDPKLLNNRFDYDAYLQSLMTLASWGKHSKSALPDIVKALGEAGGFYRKAAARALGQIGPDAKGTLPTLEKALKDPDQEVVAAAKKAIEKIKSAK